MARFIESPYIRNGTPDGSVEDSLYASGELGGLINWAGRIYQQVQLLNPEKPPVLAPLRRRKKTAEELAAEEGEPVAEEKSVESHRGHGKFRRRKEAAALEGETPEVLEVPNPPNPVKAGQLAFWADANSYVVTNDPNWGNFRDSNGVGIIDTFRQNVAGVFRADVKPGQYCWVVQRGKGIDVKEKGAATASMALVAADESAEADALGMEAAAAKALAATTLGTVTEDTVDGLCVANLNIESMA